MDNKNWKSITVSIDNYHAVRGTKTYRTWSETKYIYDEK